MRVQGLLYIPPKLILADEPTGALDSHSCAAALSFAAKHPYAAGGYDPDGDP